MSTAWRKALHFTATVKRNTTSVSASGATKFVYATIFTGVQCSVQYQGGRLRQDDPGQMGLRKNSALFGEEMIGQLRQNDIIVLENSDVGRTYRLTSVHEVIDPNAPHVECVAEQVVTAGGD